MPEKRQKPEKQFILILGGVRSGKSAFALELARRMGQRVTFIATARAEDEEMRRRIEEHRKARPPHWRTIEAALGAAHALRQHSDQAEVILLDCLTLLVSNLLLEAGEGACVGEVEARVMAEVAQLLAAFKDGTTSLIVVSNEVGMGVVPPHPLGRAYRDLLGKANQMVSQAADKVYWMLAGLPVEIKASGLAATTLQPCKAQCDGQT
jgi:adenosylcobinamide kinase/adenosylcobinamide-phosphate guanylyltransferase